MKLGRCYYAKPKTSNYFPGRKHYRYIQGFVIIMLFLLLLLFPLGLVSISIQANPTNDVSQVPEISGQSLTFGDDTNYLYNDPSSETNYVEDGERESTGKSVFVQSDKVTFPKGVSEVVKTRRRNKLLQNSHYKKRQKLLDSLFISVKTTKRFHSTRLEPILRTWFNLARDQTWIFTDADDPTLLHRTGGHIINTNCPSTHYRQALCCKMSAEFDTFLHSGKSWFCHVDDDNYLNVPALLDLLEKYDPKEHWYLGKPSLKKPIHFKDPDNKSEDVSFWFGTGGAGFCLSRALALRMSPLASGGKFMKLCDRIQLPDDVTIGYVAGHLLGQNLTVIHQFHSHFETMKFINTKNAEPEITFSYMRTGDNVNILDIDGYFNQDKDPTRFLSLHCLLFPNFSFCPKNKR